MTESRYTPQFVEKARQAIEAGDPEGGQGRLQEVVLGGVPYASDTWFQAAHYLAVSYGSVGRVFESWLCAQAAARWARQAGDVKRLAQSLAIEAAGAAILEDRESLSQALVALEGVLGQAGSDVHPWIRQDFHEASVKAALLAKDELEARRHLRHMEAEIDRRSDAGGIDHHSLRVLQARVGLLSADLDEARHALRRALPSLPDDAVHQMAWGALRLELHMTARDREAAWTQARRTLADLERTAGLSSIAYVRIEIGCELAGHFDELDEMAPAVRTRNLVAKGILERICQIDRWADEFKRLGVARGIQSIDVIRRRTEFVAEQREVLRTIAKWFASHADIQRIVVGSHNGMATICAWCERLRSASSGEWIPVGEYVPRDGSIRVSHGICQPCAQREEEGRVQVP